MNKPLSAKLLAEKEDAISQRIEVTVFTANAQFDGYILCQPNKRLLDVLNSGFNLDNVLSHDFLEIRDVNIFDHQSKNSIRHLDIGYARRSNIIFVGERKCVDSCRMELPYSMREKKPIPAEVEMPHIVLKGAMHAEIWQDLPGALNRNDQFLPLTDVELNSPLADGVNKFDFVAVNRDHIIFIGR